MHELIQADTETLFKQAPMTAQTYMLNAVHDIDKSFGEGYAAKNPQLVAAYMRVAASDFNTAISFKVLESRLEALSESLTALADSLAAGR